MSATTVIAIYGAAVATAGVAWQVWLRSRARRTQLRLYLKHSAYPSEAPELAGRLVYRVSVLVVNVGETQETVLALGVEKADHGWGVDDRPINEPLPPGRVVERSFDLIGLTWDPTPGVIPYVEIASRLGKAFGEPEPLNDDLIEQECWPVYAHAGVPAHLRPPDSL